MATKKPPIPAVARREARNRALRVALGSGAYDSFMALAIRRALLLEQGTRSVERDSALDFAREIEAPLIAAISGMLAGITTAPRDVPEPTTPENVGSRIPPAPPRMPTELPAAMKSITDRGGQRVFSKMQRQMIEIARQEAAFGASAMVRSYGTDALADVPLARIESDASLPPTGPIGGDAAAVEVERIAETAAGAPMFGKLMNDVWGKSIESFRGKVEEVVGTGLQRGSTLDDIVRSLRGTKAKGYADGMMGKWRGANVKAFVRTAATHVSAKSREAAFSALGAPYVQLVATLDLRTTPQCIELDLTVWPIGEGPRPPIHVNCRTDVVPWWSEDEPEFGGKRASKDGPVPSTTKAADWVMDLPESELADIVGTTRARALKAGEITFSQLLDDSYRLRTLAELREAGLLPARTEPAPKREAEPEPRPKQ